MAKTKTYLHAFFVPILQVWARLIPSHQVAIYDYDVLLAYLFTVQIQTLIFIKNDCDCVNCYNVSECKWEQVRFIYMKKIFAKRKHNKQAGRTQTQCNLTFAVTAVLRCYGSSTRIIIAVFSSVDFNNCLFKFVSVVKESWQYFKNTSI